VVTGPIRVTEFNYSVDISREDEAEVLGRVEVTWKAFDRLACC
jgi:hypothetical protein